MVQASTSAAFTADKVRAGMALAAEMIAAAAMSIATTAGAINRISAGAINRMGEGFRPRAVGAADPPAILMIGPPLRGPFLWSGGVCIQIWEKIRPTSHAAIAQPAPVKKPTQNQTPTW